ncbi:CYTH domain-containing protein [Bacillus cereus group sp. N12]|uniref:CYTH domain-containing protein n=1 Tax=Bacillus cereus group sp. N12 TaxID=2794586 RepID=UPI0018F730E8|nr:CYTH domain-containing protein [Bacillus cereus group sp. N12]MBJ8078349.1 CYTH domain-containing protein [Bacillus cereus group sp. N12]
MENEREIKLSLTEEQYNLILKSAINPKKKVQSNYYYDTENYDIQKGNNTLRVRNEQNSIELTLKIKNKTEDGITYSTEYNQVLNQEQYNDLLKNSNYFSSLLNEEVTSGLKEIDINKIKYVGKTHNIRVIFSTSSGLLFHLDKTTFPGDTTEFELEIENAEYSYNIFEELKETYGITPIINEQSKYKRFIKHISKLQNENRS